MSKARDIADLDFNAPDIDGGNIDGAVIGATTAAAGTFLAINSGAHLINASSSAFGGSSVQGFNTDFLVDTGQGYTRHNSYHTGGSNHQFLVNEAGSTTNAVALSIAKDKSATFSSSVAADNYGFTQNSSASGVQDAIFRSTTGRIEVRAGNVDDMLVIDGTNGVIVNDGGVDRDFRVASDALTHALFVEGNTSNVYMGSSANIEGGRVQVTSAKTLTANIPYGMLGVNDNTAMAQGVGGAINFCGMYHSNGSITSLGSVEGYKTLSNNGNYDGTLVLKARAHGGNQVDKLRLNSTEAVFNPGELDTDFRVASNSSSHALFLNSSELRWGINRTDPQKTLEISSNLEQLRLSTASAPTNYYTDIASRYDSSNPFRMTGYYNGTTVKFLEMTASGGFSGPILKVGQGMSYTAFYTGATERISIQPTKGHTYENISENWTGNIDASMAKGQRFVRTGSIANEQKIRIFLGSYTYSGGTISYVLTGPGGSQNHIGQGTITWFTRESTVHYTITGTNVNNQIIVVPDQYTTGGAANKFIISTRATTGDSHFTIQNRLGGTCYLALDVKLNYTG